MDDNTLKRLSRLTSILTILQSKKIITAKNLAEKFEVSPRTIYRDIRALEKSGVPIFVEEGKGFSIMDGYKIPPVMFTEEEANALLTMELIAKSSKDNSLIKEYSSAMNKLKAVLPARLKLAMKALEDKIAITKVFTDKEAKSNCLLQIQKALLENIVIRIDYVNVQNKASVRELEPFAIYSNTNEEWVVIAFCRLRNEFRSFSLSRIDKIFFTNQNFIPQNITFENFYKKYMLQN
jgi:predicted DNA-binding transcriptional regulator YafY